MAALSFSTHCYRISITCKLVEHTLHLLLKSPEKDVQEHRLLPLSACCCLPANSFLRA